MQRIRTIKPEFFKHDELYQAEVDFCLPLRIAYAGLWTCCDRDGRFKWKPRQLKLDVLPYDDVDFSRVLDALASRGFISKYSDSRDVYGCVISWKDHQAINNKETKSVLPGIDGQSITVIDVCIENQQLTEDDLTRGYRDGFASSSCLFPGQGERKGKEGKGREQEGNKNLVAASLSTRQIKKAEPNPLNKQTMNAYSNAYFNRYGTEPKPNAKNNSLIAELVKRLGDEAPHVAAFYLTHNGSWYVQKLHALDFLIKDAEAMRTQWATDRTVTQHQARSADKLGDIGNRINQAFSADEVY